MLLEYQEKIIRIKDQGFLIIGDAIVENNSVLTRSTRALSIRTTGTGLLVTILKAKVESLLIACLLMSFLDKR